MTRYEDVVSLADVEAARERIADVAFHTPLDPSTTFARLSGATEVRLKLDNMQRTGAYKVRGAYNHISRLPEADLDRGVIASSAGNHAQGVAYATQALGVDATIVMPEVTPAAKIAATRGYGAEVVIHGDIYEQSYQHALHLAEERGLTFVHPFDEPAVIAGQGTIGLEILDDFPEVDTVLAAVGGGGLVSGIATALKSRDPDIRVVGVQTEGCAHVNESLRRGEIYERDGIDTITEGIAASRMGENTFPLVRERVDEIVEVTDEDVTVALALLAERAKTVAEGAGAVPVAAVLSGAVDVTDENVAVIVSGGNIDLTEHGELCRTGLMHLGRYRRVRLGLRSWDALGAVTEVLKVEGAELDDLRREPVTAGDDPNRHPVTVGIEGTGPEHLDAVVDALDDHSGIEVISG